MIAALWEEGDGEPVTVVTTKKASLDLTLLRVKQEHVVMETAETAGLASMTFLAAGEVRWAKVLATYLNLEDDVNLSDSVGPGPAKEAKPKRVAVPAQPDWAGLTAAANLWMRGQPLASASIAAPVPDDSDEDSESALEETVGRSKAAATAAGSAAADLMGGAPFRWDPSAKKAGRGLAPPAAPFGYWTPGAPASSAAVAAPDMASFFANLMGGRPGAQPAASVGGAPLMPGTWAGFGGGPPDLQQMINLEMLKMMRKMRGVERDSDSDSEDGLGRGGREKRDFDGIQRSRRKFRKQPKKVVESYVTRVRSELGVNSPTQHWELRDYSKKVQPLFGRMRGLWRCHHAVSEMVQLLLAGDLERGAAFGVLLLQGLVQVAIDQGSWENGALIIPTEDPLSRPVFGAEEQMLKDIFRYRKALKELRTQHPKGHEDAGADEPAPEKGPKKDYNNKDRKRGGGAKKQE